MTAPSLLYLSREDVAAVGPGMAEILGALATAFRELGRGRVEMPPKPGIHPGGGDNFIPTAAVTNAIGVLRVQYRVPVPLF